MPQQQPKMDQAMAMALKRAVFARPAAGAGHPNQTSQGPAGALGAPYGHAQGYIGANVPQMGAQKAPGAAAPQQGPGAAAPTGTPGGGFAHLLPILAALFAHLFGGGGMAGGPQR